MMPKPLRYLIYCLIALNLFLGAWLVLNQTIIFHTDIARDFLILQDIVKTHKPTLIGPRAGGITGVFHGPLWFYLNLPIFLLGRGNPIVVGWFWVVLSIFSLFIVYWCGKKLFNQETALLASLLYSVFLIRYTPGLFNSFGSLMLFPLFFYLFRQYQKTVRPRYLVYALLVLGLIMQFELSFGSVILILSTIYLAYFLIKKKKLIHLFSFAILPIPLATFIVFELRHNFFQLKSILHYLATKQAGQLTFPDLLSQRLKGALFDGLNLFPPNTWFIFPFTILFIWLIYKLRKNKLKFKDEYWLYFYFYLGFWLVVFVFKGTIWSFFYWAFLPMTLLIFASTINLIDKKLFAVLFLLLFIPNFYISTQGLKDTRTNWKIYYQSAKDIFKDAGNQEFGYYPWSPDQYGYSERYALSYAQQEFPNVKSYPYVKKTLTYLIKEPRPKDQPWINNDWWQSHQVKITSKPIKTTTYINGLKVEKYLLTDEEVKNLSDPTLIQDLTFR